MAFQIQPLNDAIGSEIRGDIQELLKPEASADLRQLLVERGVLVFRELNLSEDDHVALARQLGNVRDELGNSIYKIAIDKKNNAHGDYLKGSFLWHIDGTHDRIPPLGTVLTGRVLSGTGGQTEFANSYAAYEQLSDDMKQRLDGLQVVHRVETSMRRAGIETTEDNLAYWRSFEDTTHSLVWTHACGRKSLVIGCHADHIVGLQRSESDTLLQELLEWTTQDRFKYRHEWSVGDTIAWDNTGVLHRAEPYPLDSGRLMHRTTLLGEEAFS